MKAPLLAHEHRPGPRPAIIAAVMLLSLALAAGCTKRIIIKEDDPCVKNPPTAPGWIANPPREAAFIYALGVEGNHPYDQAIAEEGAFRAAKKELIYHLGVEIMGVMLQVIGSQGASTITEAWNEVAKDIDAMADSLNAEKVAAFQDACGVAPLSCGRRGFHYVLARMPRSGPTFKKLAEKTAEKAGVKPADRDRIRQDADKAFKEMEEMEQQDFSGSGPGGSAH